VLAQCKNSVLFLLYKTRLIKNTSWRCCEVTCW